jgi:hypothetical protein
MKKRVFDIIINIMPEVYSAEAYIDYFGNRWAHIIPYKDQLITSFFSGKNSEIYYEMSMEDAVNSLSRGKKILEERLEVLFENAILTYPDFEEPLVEITYQSITWVEISQETERLVMEMFTQKPKGYWEFSLDKAIEEIIKAKKRLLCE